MKPLILTLLSLILIAAGMAYAAESYMYKCPKCSLIQALNIPKGFVYCPNDGALLLPCR